MPLLFTGASVIFTMYTFISLLRDCAKISTLLAVLLAVLMVALVGGLLFWGVRATQKTGKPMILASAGIILAFGLAALLLRGEIIGLLSGLLMGSVEQSIPQLVE